MPFNDSKIPAQKLDDSHNDIPDIRVKTAFNGYDIDS
jgi:hypothetical protein